MAQSVKHLILDFSSGHELMVHKFKPCIGLCADSTEPAWNSLSSLSAPPPLMHTCSLPLKINKYCLKARILQSNAFSLK